jgi:hypothetical protein
VGAKKVKATGSYFDAATLEEKSEEVTIDFVPAASFDEAMSRINSDEKLVVKAVNALLLTQAKAQATRTINAKGLDTASLFNFIRPMRESEPYASMLVNGPDGKVTAESRAAQTKALIEFVASIPSMLGVVRSMSERARATDDSE